jgi:hypothetical protein
MGSIRADSARLRRFAASACGRQSSPVMPKPDPGWQSSGIEHALRLVRCACCGGGAVTVPLSGGGRVLHPAAPVCAARASAMTPVALRHPAPSLQRLRRRTPHTSWVSRVSLQRLAGSAVNTEAQHVHHTALGVRLLGRRAQRGPYSAERSRTHLRVLSMLQRLASLAEPAQLEAAAQERSSRQRRRAMPSNAPSSARMRLLGERPTCFTLARREQRRARAGGSRSARLTQRAGQAVAGDVRRRAHEPHS